jgi:subtilisin family serine protease
MADSFFCLKISKKGKRCNLYRQTPGTDMTFIRTVVYWLLSVSALVLVSFSTHAQSREKDGVVLKQGSVLLTDAAQWLDSFRATIPEKPAQVLVRFSRLPNAAAKARMRTEGLQLLGYTGNNVFTAILHARLNQQTIVREGVQGLRAMEPAWKIDPSVTAGGLGKMTVMVSWYKGVEQSELEAHIAACGGAIVNRKTWALNAAPVMVPASQLLRLADWYGIRYVGSPARDTALNIESANAGKVNTAAVPMALGGRELDGSGIVVGVGDNYSGLAHADLNDRITNFHPWPYHNHGVHINGIVGGAGIVDPKGRGMAPGVRLLDHVYSEVWQQTVAMKQAYDMTLTNNSYAAMGGNCNYAGLYDIYSEMLDQLALEEPVVQHVFAAGNDGNNTCAPYPQGFGTVVGAYQSAKNVIVVASNTKWYEHVPSSSRGPARDGRLKPEISAVGHQVYSTVRDDGYLSSGGTSMASPAVTGALALLSQRYRQLHNAAPRGDLLKALILNGATDHGNPGPDYSFGFGVLNLQRSLEMLELGQFSANTLEHNDRQSFTVSVPANTAVLKVMLYWHDQPGDPTAARTLVNDLDLEVSAPGGIVHLPLVLKDAPAEVTQPAAPGVDRRNNVEQVVISNPAAGTYTISVKGFEVPEGPQHYVVAWDLVPTGVQLTFPTVGSSWPAGDSMQIYWDASPGTNTFKLEFSSDNGNTWTVIADNIPPAQRHFTWVTPNVSAARCRMRLTRNNTSQQHASAAFTINPQPVVQLAATQCPGYMAITWDAVPNATGYQILRKIGNDMQVVDTVATTAYTFSGLPVDQWCYAAVQPLMQGVPGWRSIAVRRRPDNGDCIGTISDGDLMAARIISPISGRMHTATQLTASETLTLMIRNLDDVPVNSFRIWYSVGNAGWQSQDFQLMIPANSSIPVSISGLDLSLPGSYELTAVVQNLSATDPVAANDTIRKMVRQLQNDPVDPNSGFIETFEATGTGSLSADSMGITADERWDFFNSTDTGRLRFLVSPEITISGDRSVSMDAWMPTPDNQNYLDGTFNLAGRDILTEELRLEFDYKLHGKPRFSGGNQVWARGGDEDSWVPVFTYDTLRDAGEIIGSGSLSLTDALLQRGQSLSASFQLRFGQHDTSVIAANSYGNGLTLDNIRLYTVVNDVQLLGIAAPSAVGCALGSSESLSIVVRNGYHQPLDNVTAFFRLDSGAVQTAVLPTIQPKDTLVFTFPQTLDLSALGAHMLDVWLAANGDTYTANDSILGFVVRSQPLFTSFPYLEQFEQNDGYWYTGGRNSSWEYGTPASVKISRAASGTKVWKTNLKGYYNSSEVSYLYSPCFNLSGLRDPMLSFSLALDIEHCDDQPCDAAFIEYSVDGGAWQKLGKHGEGTNWYNTDRDVWSVEGFTRWHVTSIPLPAADNLRLRLVLNTDIGVNLEGVAVDDIHIFDRARSIYEGGNTGIVNGALTPNQWTDFTADDRWLAQMRPPDGQAAPGSAAVSLYRHDRFFHEQANQYFFPVNYVLNIAQELFDSVSVRFFLAEADMVALLADSSCPTCSMPRDAYELGVTQYSDPLKVRENDRLEDNVSGSYVYYPSKKISWVPYDNGYYAALKLRRFSEFWFNDGGPLGAFSLHEPAIALHADKISNEHAALHWVCKVDTAVSEYLLQRSEDSVAFSDIALIPARRQQETVYGHMDTPSIATDGKIYYRIKYTLNNGRVYYSATRRVDWTPPNQLFEIFPNPARNGYVAITWSSPPSGQMDVSVTDMMGRQVFRQQFPAETWNNVTVLRIPGLASGMYLVRVIIAGNLYERKLVVQ